MSAQPQMPALIGKRKLFMLFAPLAILVTAAVVTNFGGGVSKDAHAATVNVSATVLPSITLTMCGGGSQHLRASDDAVFTDSGYTTPGVNGSWAFNIDSAGSAFSGSTCALGYTVSNQANRAISVADAAGGGNFLSASSIRARSRSRTTATRSRPVAPLSLRRKSGSASLPSPVLAPR